MNPQTSEKASPASPSRYIFGEFCVDVGARKLMGNGMTIPLPSRVFDVLVYLIEHRDRPVQKEEIITAIWNRIVVTDDSLIHAISVLRRTLSDERHNPLYIETIHRRGYRFVGNVQTIANGAEDNPVIDGAGPDPVAGHSTESIATAGGHGRKRDGTLGRLIPVVAVAVFFVLLSALFVFRDNRQPAEVKSGASVRLLQPPPPGTSIASGGVLSPDGRYLAFVARDDAGGIEKLWIKALQSGEMWHLEGTVGASKPFWSPDARHVGFFAGGKLLTTALYNDSPQVIADVTSAAGATWSHDDRILFAEWPRGLYIVPASGDGNVRSVATLDKDAEDIVFAWPQFFPDSSKFMYQVISLDPGRTGVYVGDLDSHDRYKLLDTTSPATFAPPHHLLHVQKDMLIAEEFDPQRLELTGRAMVIARGITEPTIAAENYVSASTDLIAFENGVRQQNLVWFNRKGDRLEELRMPKVLYNPRISPDGRQLLANGSITSDPGLWLASLDKEEFSRLGNDAIGPVWSPDGKNVAFTSRGGFDMKMLSLDGRKNPVLLASDDKVKILNDWSKEGDVLVFSKQGEKSGLDLWALKISDGSTVPLCVTPFNETQARISPDGEWMAWSSDESGALEVYVARFPGLEDKLLVSSGGGGQPQWKSDQKELFYLSMDGTIMSVAVKGIDPFRFDAPHRMFGTSIAGDPADARDYYAIDADGARFLVDNAEGENKSQGITVIVNWADGLRESYPDQASAGSGIHP